MMRQSGGRIAISELAGALAVSERTLQRRFAQAIGLTPKRAARIVLFNEVRQRLIHRSEPDLTRLAADVGYADHGHLSRSFQEHFGVSPARFRSWANQMVD